MLRYLRQIHKLTIRDSVEEQLIAAQYLFAYGKSIENIVAMCSNNHYCLVLLKTIVKRLIDFNMHLLVIKCFKNYQFGLHFWLISSN